ncbi:MAG: DMT family transporter [Haloarculaceae archaeon]
MLRDNDGVAFAVLTIVWGLGFSAAEAGFSSFPPLLLMAFRYDLGTVLLFGYVAVTVDDWWPSTSGDLVALASGGVLLITGANGIWFVGQNLTTSVFSGMMASLFPVLTAAFSWLLLPEDRLTPLSLVGLFVSFAGALLIMLPNGGFDVDANLIGKLVLFLSACSGSLGSVLIRRAETSIPSTAQSAWSVAIGALLLHALSLFLGESWDGTVTLASGIGLVYLSVFSTAVVWILYFSLLQRRSAIEILFVSYLLPIVAGIAGWVFFGEVVTTSMVVGFPVVVAGFALMKRQTIRQEFRRRRNRA